MTRLVGGLFLLAACTGAPEANETTTTSVVTTTAPVVETTTSAPAPTTTTFDHPFPLQTIVVDGESLLVWVGDNPDDRAQGLMFVEEMPDGVDGMLFVFESESQRQFHMLNTLIPLDIWWFDGVGVLTGVTQMAPCEQQPCERYPSPGPVLYALETPLGEWSFPTGSLLATPAGG